MNKENFKKINFALSTYWNAYKAHFAAKNDGKKMGKYVYRSLQVSIFAEAKKGNVLDVCTDYLTAAQNLESNIVKLKGKKDGCGKIVLAAKEPIKEALSWWVGLSDQSRQNFINRYVNACTPEIVSSIYVNVLGLHLPYQK